MLLDGTMLFDGFVYEGMMFGVGEGFVGGMDSNFEAGILFLCMPNGADTDDNGADFQVVPSTPGAANP